MAQPTYIVTTHGEFSLDPFLSCLCTTPYLICCMYVPLAFLKSHDFDPDERSDVQFIEDPDLAYVMLRYRQVCCYHGLSF